MVNAQESHTKRKHLETWKNTERRRHGVDSSRSTAGRNKSWNKAQDPGHFLGEDRKDYVLTSETVKAKNGRIDENPFIGTHHEAIILETVMGKIDEKQTNRANIKSWRPWPQRYEQEEELERG